MAHKKTKKNPKGAGRPKGSKNTATGLRLALLHKRKRGPGRPRKHSSEKHHTVHAIHNGRHVVITGTLKYK